MPLCFTKPILTFTSTQLKKDSIGWRTLETSVLFAR